MYKLGYTQGLNWDVRSGTADRIVDDMAHSGVTMAMFHFTTVQVSQIESK